jgi:hypothetical protein
MTGLLLGHRKAVAAVVAVAAFGLVATARWMADDSSADSRPWASVAAAAYCAVSAVLFSYLGTDRARDALAGKADSIATARIVVALSPTVVGSVLHLAGTDPRVLWLVVGTTVAQLVVWSGLSVKRAHRRPQASDPGTSSSAAVGGGSGGST